MSGPGPGLRVRTGLLIPGKTTHPLEWALICLDGRSDEGGAWHTEGVQKELSSGRRMPAGGKGNLQLDRAEESGRKRSEEAMASAVRAEGLGQGRGEIFSATILAVFWKLIHLMTHFWVIWGTRVLLCSLHREQLPPEMKPVRTRSRSVPPITVTDVSPVATTVPGAERTQ